MAYWDIATMVADTDLTSRVAASAAQEHAPGDPAGWAFDHRWDWAAQPGWDAAWASAVAAGNEHPGQDAGVITDGMILSAVQSILAEQP
jgi:hypothetical protein